MYRIDPEPELRQVGSVQLCQEQLTYELDDIRVCVRALGEPADEAECLVLAVNEPPVGMKTCIFCELRISFSKLRTCCRTCGVIQGQPHDIQQIRTFLVHSAVHNRL